MKLPNLPFLQKKGDSEYILVLLLRQEKANAVIIEKNNRSIKILNQHEEFFSTNLEDATNEEWLDILDTAISRAEETLPPNIETHQTVFGLPNYWVEEKQIKKEYLQKLKHASDELDLKPIGFIEIPEAIVHMIQEGEGAPVSALLAEIGKKHVVVSLSRAGRILETRSAPIQESSVQTIDSLLKKFSDADILPSRLIVYNGRNNDELSQALITHRWSKGIPFLHMPQISMLENGFDVNAVVQGAAEQLGVSLIGAFSDNTSPKITTLQSQINDVSDHTANDESEDTTESTSLTEASPESFGFVLGKDIHSVPENEMPEEKEADENDDSQPKKEITSDNLRGFDDEVESELVTHPKKHDTVSDEPQFAASSHPSSESDVANPKDNGESDASDPKPKEKRFALPNISLPFSVASLTRLLSPNGRIPNNKLVLLIPGLLIILIVLGALYMTMLRATIEVNVRPEIAEDEVEVLFTSTGPSDFSDNVLAAKTTNIRLSGTVSTNATGEKETGEKAKGTVTLFNSSNSKKELPEGTVITSSNDLDFALDKSVIIASASGNIFSGIQSGTAKVPVTASSIGKESNLPSGTTFSVGDDSSLAAKNDEAFSGGTMKEITVVSQNDIAKLTKDLPATLRQKAEDGINEKLGRQEVLLTVFTDFTPRENEFSAGVGEEASEVTLNAVVEFTGVFYDNIELVDFTKTIIKDTFAQDLTLDESGIRNTLTDIEENDDGDYEATLSIEANLLPKIDTEKLKEDFKGKSFDEVNKRFGRLPQVINTRISLFPPIPFLPQIMPRRAENIDILVTSNE